jgi:hypothetical protein
MSKKEFGNFSEWSLKELIEKERSFPVGHLDGGSSVSSLLFGRQGINSYSSASFIEIHYLVKVRRLPTSFVWADSASSFNGLRRGSRDKNS